MGRPGLPKTIQYFLGLHAGLILVLGVYAATGLTLDDMYISLKERFNLNTAGEWCFDTILYVYVDHFVWALTLLTLLTLKRKGNISISDIIASSFLAGAFSTFFQVNHSINAIIDNTPIDTVYYWLLLVVTAVFLFGFIRPSSFHLTQRFVHFKSLIMFGFLIFLHANLIFNGVYPLGENIAKDQRKQAADIEYLAKSMSPDDYIKMAEMSQANTSFVVRWSDDEPMPVISDEAKGIFDHQKGMASFSMAWSHINSFSERSDPSTVVEFATRNEGVNVVVRTLIRSELSASLYPQFYSIIYVSMAAFILAWSLLLSFILVKHARINK